MWQVLRRVRFSSRRRHTRFDCDWSSDVCSSDLDENTSSDDVAGLGGELRGLHSRSAASLEAVLLHRRHLPETVFHDDKEAACFGVRDARGFDHHITRAEIDATDSGGGSSHVADVVLLETDGHAFLRENQNLIFAACGNDPAELVSWGNFLRDEAGAADVVELREIRAFHGSFALHHEEVLLLFLG